MSEETPAPVYPPSAHRESRPEVILAFVRAVGFGQLITGSGGIPYATAVPMLLRLRDETVVLEAHLQRGNPQWRALGEEALVLFEGPNAYVHPGWYPSKKRDGRAVPTWNYIVVQGRGSVEVVEDPDWLRDHLAALSARQEEGRADPWRLEDAPPGYIEALIRGIVGVRVTVRAWDGRWKLSQNHPEANRRGVIAGLAESDRAGDREIALAMTRLEAGEG